MTERRLECTARGGEAVSHTVVIWWDTAHKELKETEFYTHLTCGRC